MKTTKSITPLILLFVILFSSCGNDLSRSKAKELIISKQNLPLPETMELRKRYGVKAYNDVIPSMRYEGSELRYIDYKNVLNEYQSKGLVTISEKDVAVYESLHQVYKEINLTKKGQKYLVEEDNDKFIFKTCDIDFGEITGIQIREQFKEAEVNYTLAKVNKTPFWVNTSDEIIKKSASFSLFDDGWRIN